MENKDSNKGKQNTKEGLCKTDIDPKINSQESMLNEEIEIDAQGNKKIVQRARNVDGSIAPIPDEEITWNDNESLSRGVRTEEEAMNTVENEDLNSDITANRYPVSHPDNQTDRGNMKLDE